MSYSHLFRKYRWNRNVGTGSLGCYHPGIASTAPFVVLIRQVYVFLIDGFALFSGVSIHLLKGKSCGKNSVPSLTNNVHHHQMENLLLAVKSAWRTAPCIRQKQLVIIITLFIYFKKREKSGCLLHEKSIDTPVKHRFQKVVMKVQKRYGFCANRLREFKIFIMSSKKTSLGYAIS